MSANQAQGIICTIIMDITWKQKYKNMADINEQNVLLL